MATAMPYIAMAMTAVGTYASYKSQSEAAAGQKDAAREASRLAEMNAQMSERETTRNAENMQAAQEREQATNRAKAAASGISGGGSFDLVMDEQKRIHGEEQDWLKQSGASKADIIRQGGALAQSQGYAQADATRAGSWGTLIGGAQSIYGTGSQAEMW